MRSLAVWTTTAIVALLGVANAQTSGAGDTAIALLTLALAAGFNLQDAADIANHASGIVVGKLGTATLTPDELLAAFS